MVKNRKVKAETENEEKAMAGSLDGLTGQPDEHVVGAVRGRSRCCTVSSVQKGCRSRGPPDHDEDLTAWPAPQGLWTRPVRGSPVAGGPGPSARLLSHCLGPADDS